MKRKKGFTLVELIVVIAIIAVLSAVLIPTFTSVIARANKAADIQLVKNLNTLLSLDINQDLKDHSTMFDALKTAESAGISVDEVKNNKTRNHIIAWDSQLDRFVLIDTINDKCVYPSTNNNDDEQGIITLKYQYFAIYDEMPTEQTYSIYATDSLTGDNGKVNLTVGFDQGSNVRINSLIYDRLTADSSRKVIIRTNNGTTCEFNGYDGVNESDTIYHYGESGNQTISVGQHSFCEYGAATEVEVKKGHYVQENGSIVAVVNASATNSDVVVDLKSGSIQGTVKNTNTEHIVTINGESGVITINFEGNTEGGDLIVNLSSKPTYTNKTDMQQEAYGENPAIKLSGLGAEEGAIPSYDDVGEDNAECISVAGYSIKVYTNCNAYSHSKTMVDENIVKENTYTIKFDENGDSIKFNSSDDHIHTFGGPSWSWDGYQTATATFVCTADDCNFTEKVIVPTNGGNISGEEKTPATCTETGEKTYTAHLTHHGNDFTNDSPTKGVVDALGHDYQFDSFVWSDDYYTAKAKYVCKNDNSHVELYDAEVTSNQSGNVITYTATYDGHTDTKTKTLSATFTHSDNFANVDKYLYRVGNGNMVALGILFKVEEGTTVSDNKNVSVTVSAVDGLTLSGAYNNNSSDWTKSTIQFTGTGPVKVTIQDGGGEAYTLNLEVVDAVNATSATSATSNNVVLLNDVNFSTITVSNGYTLYGNGFTMTSANDLSIKTLLSDNGYVTLNNGILDNVQIICPVFTKAVMYSTNASKDSDGKLLESRNAVSTLGRSTIVNSYISGGRTAIYAGGSQLEIENTTIHGGALANMLVNGSVYITMTDCITEQEVETCTLDSSKEMMGLGVLVDSSSALITLEGEFTQYNWVTQAQVSQYAGSISNTLSQYFNNTTFKHTYGGTDYLNTGIVYMCDWDSANVADNLPAYLTDNRVNKSDYSGEDVTIAGVNGGIYTVNNNCSLTAKMLSVPIYQPSKFNPTAPKFSFDNSANTNTEFDDNTINVTTTSDSVELDFSGASIKHNGQEVNYTISVDSDKATVNGKKIIFSKNQTDYNVEFTADINGSYLPDGSVDENETTRVRHIIAVHITIEAYDPPEWNGVSTTGSNHVWVVEDPGTSDPDYAEIIPVYNGIKVNYYNQDGVFVEKDLSRETVVPTIAENNKSAFVTFSDGSKLIIETDYATNNYIFKTCENIVYLWQSRYYRNNRDSVQKILTYTFSDPNGQSTDNTVSVTYTFNTTSPGTYIKKTEFEKGKYTTCSGEASSICLATGTLITLADGSQKMVEDLNPGDQLLVFNHLTGLFESGTFLYDFHDDNHDNTLKEVLRIAFDNGNELEIIVQHRLFDATINQYIDISIDNIDQYINDEFISIDPISHEITKTKISNYEIYEEIVGSYSPVVPYYMNYIAGGMLNGVGNFKALVNYFDYNNDLSYNEETMQQDIETYGLYDYEVFAEYVPYEIYEAFNGQYLKIAVEKGLCTFDEIIQQIKEYVDFYLKIISK